MYLLVSVLLLSQVHIQNQRSLHSSSKSQDVL